MSGREEGIVEALRERRLQDALAGALAWWREQPVAQLASVIARLDRHVPAAASFAKAAEAVLSSGNSIKTRANLEALCDAWAPDPRLTDYLLSYFDDAPFDYAMGNGALFGRVLVARLVAQPDERVATWLVAWRAYLQARKGTRKGKLSVDEIAALGELLGAAERTERPMVRALDARQRGILDGIEAELAPLDGAAGSAEEQRLALLGQVILDFSDDGAKQVYADWLLEHGEQAGEAILLSLRGDALPKAEQARLNAFYSAFPNGTTYEKGFPVSVFTADSYGVRKGTYTTEPEWGTVVATDMVPSSDACHTQRLDELHVGSSFAEELAKLTRPLGVRHLVMTSFNRSARAAWKRVTVLPALTKMTMKTAVSASDLAWLVGKTELGQRVTELILREDDELAEAVPSLFVSSPRLLRVSVGTTLRFDRSADGDAIDLALSVATKEEIAVSRALVSALPARSLGHVAISSPLDAALLRELAQLGRTSSVEVSNAGVVARAQVEREGDTLRIEPSFNDLFDAVALRELLAAPSASAPPPRHVVVKRNWDARALAALFAAAAQAEVATLELVRPTRSRIGESSDRTSADHVVLTIAREALAIELDGSGSAPLIEAALAQLGIGRRVTVRLAPGMSADQRAAVEQTVRQLSPQATIEPVPQASLFRTAWNQRRKRLAVVPRVWSYAHGLLAPATVDELLATAEGKPAEVVLYVERATLAPWVEWLAGRAFALGFCRDWDAKMQPHFMMSSDGRGALTATVKASYQLPFMSSELRALPKGTFARITLEGAIPADWVSACEHAAVTLEGAG